MEEDFFLSTGQITFAICFFVAFVVAMFFAFKKDIKKQPQYSKGAIKIVLAVLAFAALIILTFRVLN